MGKNNSPRAAAGTAAAGTAASDVVRRVETLVAQGGADRADRYIAETLRILSRSQIKARGATIEVDGKAAKLSRPLRADERLVVTWTEEPSPGLEAENIALDVIYENDRVLVINKAQGMVTHPGAGNRRGTLANAVLGRLSARPFDHRGTFDDTVPVPRGGIVHRLDKDTSGVIIAAKDSEAQAFLAAQFKARAAHKDYLAITRGVPRGGAGGEIGDWNRIESRIGRDKRNRKRFTEVDEGGRLSVTDWRVMAVFGDFALVHLKPRTGRTHQLRVHLAGLGCPIVGDPLYGDGPKGPPPGMTLMLHAWKLAIRLPGSDEISRFVAPLPERFSKLLRLLERRNGKRIFPSAGARGRSGR